MILGLAIISSALIQTFGLKLSIAGDMTMVEKAPEFTHTSSAEWINSPPLQLKDLSGKVVLIDFWTFDCWNCYRSFPWLNTLEKKYSKEIKVIGVHSPEFSHEKIKKNIVQKVAKFKLHHPIMIDNNMSYWKAMNNRYWPAFYLIDQQGNIRARYYGETHQGDAQAKTIENQINQLLAEAK